MEKIREAVQQLYSYLACEEWLELEKTDLIFVCGNAHEGPAWQAAKLYREGRAPKILVTGLGPSADLPHPRLPEGFRSEAAFHKSILLGQGVPEAAILLEETSTNTLENVLMGLLLADQLRLQLNKIYICAVPVLLRRAFATFYKQRRMTWACPSYYLDPRFAENMLDVTRIKLMLGEIDRLTKYAVKGDIEKIEIPIKIMQAVEYLRQTYLIKPTQ